MTAFAYDDIDWPTFVQRCRKQLGLGQKNLAYQLDVTRETISRWENAKEKPSDVAQAKLRRLMPLLADESTLRSLFDTVDTIDALVTLLDGDFRILRTSQKHQELSNYDASELYGRHSERYWSAEMAAIIDALGGLDGYREQGITRMDLCLEMIRQPGEPGFRPNTKLFTFGSTITFGPPQKPIAYLTSVSIREGVQAMQPLVRRFGGEMTAIT